MTCRSCGRGFEGRFCPWCGASAPIPAPPAAPPPPVLWATACQYCGLTYAGLACPHCGTIAGRAHPGVFPRALGSVVWALAISVFLTVLAANLVTLAYAAVLVTEGAAVSGGPIAFIVLLPYPEGVVVDASPAVFLGYFGAIVATILAAYAVYAWRDGPSLLRTFRRPLVQFGWRLEARNAWVATGQVFLAAMSFQVLYILVLELAGVSVQAPTAPGLPDWYNYFLLANASVYEELVGRILLVGLPMFLAGIVYNARAGPSSARIASWRHLIGGTMNRDSPVPLLVVATFFSVASAVVFALAHVPAWGWWKFAPTVVVGLGLAYLFVRHGILSAVLAHFAIDYLGAAGLMVADDLGRLFFVGLIILVIVALGLPFFIWYFLYGGRVASHVLARTRGQRSPTTTAAAAQPLAGSPLPAPRNAPAPAWVPARCPRCGAEEEARTLDGLVTCPRCGFSSP